jgi:hypothetical protein
LLSARFYLDEDVPHQAAGLGAALGLDIVAAVQVQPSLPQPDELHLATAAGDGRVMVTYNRDDFLLATHEAFAQGKPHRGLVILTRRLPREPARVAHALRRWVDSRAERGAFPPQDYEVDWISA